jgi:alpha-beta hydrolase superfamily lysophospholipase
VIAAEEAALEAVTETVVDVGGVPMSALVSEVPQPRAVIVALHGGATTSAYFDAPGQPHLSLLRTGAALGYTVVALDRPGYGSSAAHADRMATAAQRVDLAFAAIDELLGTRSAGAGVFLMAHSMGCVLGVQMAAAERGLGLLGLEIAGIGQEYQPQAAAVLSARFRSASFPGGPVESRIAVRDMIWGPGDLYPADMSASLASASPRYEGDEVRRWPGRFAGFAAAVRVPVHYTLGDQERVWRAGPAALASIAGLFTASPRVVTDEQASAGHNLSLGLSATAYHLKVLSFAEECIVSRRLIT